MLYEGVVRAKMLFFHKNSSGRILNRFSKDIGSIDNFLPVVLVDTLIVSLIFFVVFVKFVRIFYRNFDRYFKLTVTLKRPLL